MVLFSFQKICVFYKFNETFEFYNNPTEIQMLNNKIFKEKEREYNHLVNKEQCNG